MAEVHPSLDFLFHQGRIVFGTHCRRDLLVFFPVKIEVFRLKLHFHGFFLLAKISGSETSIGCFYYPTTPHKVNNDPTLIHLHFCDSFSCQKATLVARKQGRCAEKASAGEGFYPEIPRASVG
jgi:hypothetical protein